jgi:alanine dehydrogenase
VEGSPATLLLTRGDVAALLDLDECIDAVERAFRAHGEGRALGPAMLGLRAAGGGLHVKAAGLTLDRAYLAAKTNANYPANVARRGLPAIQGVIALFDATDGRVLAVMDSIEITLLRTGAATAVAARHLARADAAAATVCGCGAQGRVQLRALARVRPLRRAWAVDAVFAQAARFAAEMTAELGLPVVATTDLRTALAASQLCVTCTPSRTAFLRRDDVAPGTFVAAVGADDADKHEVEPALLAVSTIVVDSREQCARIGDLHHALAAGVVTADAVHELGEIVAGRRPGRRAPDEIVVFDSTGTALQDVAAAAAVYEKAVRAGRGAAVSLGA